MKDEELGTIKGEISDGLARGVPEVQYWLQISFDDFLRENGVRVLPNASGWMLSVNGEAQPEYYEFIADAYRAAFKLIE